MAIPLTLEGTKGSAEDQWRRFVAGREVVATRSDLASCSGCDDCGIRCLEGIAVTHSEYEEVVRYFSALPAAVQSRIRAEEKTVPWPGAEETGATMTWCRFRDQAQGNCSVYAVRPTVCRLFGHTSWLPCPTGAVTTTLPDSDDVWNAYRAFERRTWAEWGDLLGAGGKGVGDG